MQNKTVQKLFEKDMDRRQFLAHVGAGLLAITGFSGILKYLLDYGGGHKHVGSGYGSSAYGGGQSK
jgi:hypothetical protein